LVYESDPTLFELRLDTYTLPSVVLKVVKQMRKFEVVEIVTSRIDKLHTNFPGALFDQFKLFSEGDRVKI
jgi:hypothetical protein